MGSKTFCKNAGSLGRGRTTKKTSEPELEAFAVARGTSALRGI
jgi:hypothetical protein